MSKMTIEIPDEEYKELKITAIRAGISLKDYMLQIIRSSKVLVREDGVVRVLNDDTIEALEESRKKQGKRKKYDTAQEMIKDLESNK